MKTILLFFLTVSFFANTGVVDFPRLFYSHPKMDLYDKTVDSFRVYKTWYEADEGILKKRQEELLDAERLYVFQLSGLICEYEEYYKQFSLGRSELLTTTQKLSPLLLAMGSEYRTEKNRLQKEFLKFRNEYLKKRNELLVPFWLDDDNRKREFSVIVQELLQQVQELARNKQLDLVFNAPFSLYRKQDLFQNHLLMMEKSLPFLDFKPDELFYYLRFFQGEALPPLFSAQREDFTGEVLEKIRKAPLSQSRTGFLTGIETVFIPKDRNRTFFLELQKLQSGNEPVIEKGRVAIFRKGLLELLHPLMKRFDFKNGAFKTGDVKLYVTENFYRGIMEYLKTAIAFLEPKDVENEFRALSELSAIGLEDEEKNRELSEQIEQDIFSVSEELRNKYGYTMIFHENMLFSGCIRQLVSDMNILSRDIPDISFMMLEMIFRRYAIPEEEISEIILQLKEILITGDNFKQ